MNYQELSDEQILDLYKNGDELALEFLLEKYKNLVRSKIRTYFLIGADSEDITQEGMIGLFKAVQYYNPKREASFKSFAELCITRQIITAVKTATRQKHQPLNTYVSLNKPVYDEAYEKTLMETLSGKVDNDPESLIIGQENMENIYEKIDDTLSELEKKVLRLYMDGLTYQRIGELLSRSPKSIDNALQRVKKKLEDTV